MHVTSSLAKSDIILFVSVVYKRVNRQSLLSDDIMHNSLKHCKCFTDLQINAHANIPTLITH